MLNIVHRRLSVNLYLTPIYFKERYVDLRKMIWFTAGLAFAFFGAITMLINQKYKLDGQLISGMRGVGVAALYLPALFFLTPPTNKTFWLLIVAEGLISTFYNARLYESSGRYGASSTSLINVLSIAIGMVFWWILYENRFLSLINTPAAFTGIVVSLFLVGGGFFFMTANSLKKGEIAYMIPAVIAVAIMMIVRKEIMMHADFMSAMAYYCACAIFFSGMANLTLYSLKVGNVSKVAKKLADKRILIVGVFMSLASATTIFMGNLSALYAPNPAYINALTLTTPLWTIGINRLFGIKESVKIIPAAVMVAGLAMLIFFADMPLRSTLGF